MRLCLRLVPAVLLVSFLAAVTSARGQVHVDDGAGMLSPEARSRIEGTGRRLMAEWRIPIMVMTIESLAAHGAEGRPIAEFSSSLLDRPTPGLDVFRGRDWTTGILLVQSKADKATGIYIGSGWNAGDRERIGQVSAEALAPFLSRGLHAEGIVAAAEAWERLVRVIEPPAPSYWERFVIMEEAAVGEFIGRLRNPSWRTIPYFLPWAVIPLLLWELVRPWRKRQRHLRKEISLDVFYTLFHKPLFYALIGAAICGVTGYVFREGLSRFFGVENIVAIRLNALPLWTRYLILLLAVDFWHYWIHRLLHRFDFLWEFHKVHHSAKELDVFNAIRQHFVELLVYRFLAYVPLGLVGFAVSDTFFVSLFIGIFSFFTHSNVRVPLGPLKYIFNNPQLHVWHHTVEVHDRGNVNFADALSMWDFIFGTGYSPAERADLKLGFDGIEEYPTSFFGQLVAPFKQFYRRSPKRLTNDGG